MSLRSKTNLILGIAILIIFSITAIYSYTTLLPGYYELEKKSSQDKIQQVIKAFDREISFLGTKLTDWSNWDDTYNFIEDSHY